MIQVRFQILLHNLLIQSLAQLAALALRLDVVLERLADFIALSLFAILVRLQALLLITSNLHYVLTGQHLIPLSTFIF